MFVLLTTVKLIDEQLRLQVPEVVFQQNCFRHLQVVELKLPTELLIEQQSRLQLAKRMFQVYPIEQL